MPHLKMVDQDQFPDEQDNDKARFLAQKNHQAAEDTQSNSRNLVQNMPGEMVPNASMLPPVGANPPAPPGRPC